VSISPRRSERNPGDAQPFEPLTPDRRRAMTRQHLLDAAAIVFARDGFHRSTLDAVAALAGFTKGAVYSNFKSKDDLFLALFENRVERQFALTATVLEDGSHDVSEQMPRIQELLRSGAMFWDDEFTALYLEFVLYARRNPEARAKLIASARREAEVTKDLIEREYATVGGVAQYDTRVLAEISIALFNGLGMARLIDPEASSAETIDATLQFLYDSMGVGSDPPDGE
jgi:AcrR family transcriptional regulator